MSPLKKRDDYALTNVGKAEILAVMFAIAYTLTIGLSDRATEEEVNRTIDELLEIKVRLQFSMITSLKIKETIGGFRFYKVPGEDR